MSSARPLQELLNYINSLVRSLGEIIQTIRSNIKLSLGWSVFVFLLGVVTTIIFYKLERFQNLTDIVKIGPTLLTSSVTAFQIRPILVSRERLVSYTSLQNRLMGCEGLSPQIIEELAAEAVKALEELRKRD